MRPRAAGVTRASIVSERPGFPDDGVHEYDDELLDAHFIAGDGRVNENIGLTAVHHVFHSEHNRLVDEIDGMLHDPALFTAAELADWKAMPVTAASWDYGERLFQAARFVTEMEYQHLAFEEFIRKVQPMVNLFGEGGTGYHTEINPAIRAEFAHAVYRFGHSMLTETVDRTDPTGATEQHRPARRVPQPTAFFIRRRIRNQAAGNIVRGMTRQVGNELDEFVTEALRNRLLGLPLDLATLNMARARDTGIPGLNAARAPFYAETNNPCPGAVRELGRLRLQPQATESRWSTSSPPTGRTRPSRRPAHTAASEPPRRHLLDAAGTAAPDEAQDRLRLPQLPRCLSSAAERDHHQPVSTTSTCGSVASPRSSRCSAVCSARRSTTSSRSRWRTCSSATGSTTCPGPPV